MPPLWPLLLSSLAAAAAARAGARRLGGTGSEGGAAGALRSGGRSPPATAAARGGALLGGPGSKGRARSGGSLGALVQGGAGDGRPVLTVDLVHGLGNQLFQVAALLSLAMDHLPSFAVALPRSVGRAGGRNRTYWGSALRGLGPLLRPPGGGPPEGSSGCLLEQVPHFDPFGRSCEAAGAIRPGWSDGLGRLAAACPTVTLRGLFQRGAFFARRLPELRGLLWDEGTAAAARRELGALGCPGGGGGNLSVSLHYRLGDYGPNGWVLDSGYYDEALQAVRRRLPGRRLTCLVFSDEPERAWRRSEQIDGCDGRVLVPGDVADDVSLYMMSLTEASVLADSTFSYFSAVLAPGGKRVVVAPRVQGPRAGCWAYLAEGVAAAGGANLSLEWLALPARTLSEGALLAEEVLEGPGD